MIEFLTYDLKVAVLLAVFYMFYRLMLARETFHRVNRIILLLTAVASFVLPLCVITIHETVTMQRAAQVAVGSFQVDMMDEEPATPLWQIVLPILFIIGMMVTLVHTLSSLFRIIRIIRHSERYPQTDGTTICVTGNASLAPFSWMHYIVMNRSDYETSDAAILAHERGHIRLHHSWDLLLVDTLTALQWFNPAMWMLRSDLRAIHEYEADAAVLSQGINARQYQYLLITKAAGIGGYSLANGISHSTLKNRINMMLHTKSDRSRLLKLLALLPIVGIALAVNAEKVVDVRYEESQKGIAEKKAETAAAFTTTLKYDTIPGETFTAVGTFEPVQGDVFDVVEEMPQYPGGPQALFKFLGENVHYPAEAEKAGIQGRVIATFVVEKDGSISQPTIVKSVDPLLDAEAIRVISAMPNWKPGKQNGKVVRVKYTVPLSFNLDGGGEAVEDHLCREDGTIVEIDIEKGDTTIVKPLFIVDGEVMDGKKVYAINSKTIERYYMQNGQEAIDKYGDKAKDGVILITLKKD
ncbi:MAG: M56 family metallopeptidase [Bacteroidales bacterium]|nr:M56 family metallopeptidase [Bacteroidales bacterium]